MIPGPIPTSDIYTPRSIQGAILWPFRKEQQQQIIVPLGMDETLSGIVVLF